MIPIDLMNPQGLGKKQELFAFLFNKLMDFLHDQGYRMRFGEALRTEDQQEIYLRTGASRVKRSLHQDKLAIDINLFKDGEFLTETEDHEPLGIYWESLHPLCRWGGRFGDGNHYSLEHEGRR